MTRAEAVHRALRAALLAGEFPYGRRLVEETLAERFQTSRTPVREALRRLEGEGLIELRRSRSAVVAPLSREDLDDVLRLRGMVEAEVYARAVKRFDAERIEELEAACEDLTLRHGDDAESLGARHLHFHRLLAAPGASTWDARVLEILWQATDRYLYPVLVGIIAEGAPERFRETHVELLNAVRDGSVRGMRAAVAAHLKDGAKVMAARL